MTPMDEFAPIGKRITVKNRLDIDFIEQRDLTFAIQDTDRELYTHPLVVPSYRELELARVAILNRDEEKRGNDKLYLNYSETDTGLYNATIDLSENGVLTRLELSPVTDDWGVRHQGEKYATTRISSATVVRELEAKFANKDILRPLLDSADFSAIEIPRLLAGYLKNRVPTTERTAYITEESMLQGLDFDIEDKLDAAYTSSVQTILKTERKKDVTKHDLIVTAPIQIGKAVAHKRYAYSSKTDNRQKMLTSEGYTFISSADGLSQDQLQTYAVNDQIKQDPLYSLQLGLNRLQRKYDLDDRSVA